VGEERIDLQECRYVIHYDLEWNPARMEQREGRVDRLNWGRQSEGFIDVRFLLLDGTYEERIFQTVMQRDQWFQILIGSKKKELGELPDEAELEVAQDRIAESENGGGLTSQRRASCLICGLTPYALSPP
jgi:ERCC4-related helicase